ncbi:MAG: FKBP-type peptidyl-prolyl cis-trans isomerase [Alistipes sp.]|nr:FKBP-type peptidyl-prolyl cis-trans isomerase [Candidatus Alistipes equi]
MRKFVFTAIVVCIAMAMVACGSKTTIKKGNLNGKMDSLSYCLGANIGFGLTAQEAELPNFNYDAVYNELKKGALETNDKVVEEKQEAAVSVLREYFTQRLTERRAHNKSEDEKVKADSTYKPEYVELFNTDQECDSVSMSFGYDIGCNIRASKLPLQINWLVEGLKNARQNESKVSQDDVQKFLENYFTVVRPAEALKESEKWLKKMEKKSGVKKTESGLLYKVVKQGDMTQVATSDEDEVKVNYEGKLPDGKVFDSSYERNEPAEFPLNRVIKGWTEGMKLIGVGGEIILYIPSDLAYGQFGAGRDIGPNQALQFKVELLEVKHKAAEEATEEKAEEAQKAEEAPAK